MKALIFIILLSSISAQAIRGGARVHPLTYKELGAQNHVVGFKSVYRSGTSQRVSRVDYCTGTILAQRIILTAAHCFKPADAGERVARTVHFGSEIEDSSFSSILIKSENIFIHPDYAKNRTFDLAIVALPQNLPDFAMAATLPTEDFDLPQSISVQLLGYGITKLDSFSSQSNDWGILRKTENILEAFRVDQRLGSGVCKGDSGSPALLSYSGGFVLIAVAQEVWTDLSAEQLKEIKEIGLERFMIQNPSKDMCRGHSHFMDIRTHLKWIKNFI